MKKPNLLFLMTDQQQARTVDPASPCHTPNVDRIGQGGTRFARCFTPNPICSPTRASMMTGMLPHTHGMVDCTHTVEPYRAKFDAELPFWPRLLKDAGYRTGYFGKWHIERSEKLENFGFSAYEVDNQGYAVYRRDNGFGDRNAHMKTGYAVKQKGYRDAILYGVTDEPAEATREYYQYSRGIEFLKDAAKYADRPWALFVSTQGPHDAYVVPEDYYARCDPKDIPRPPSFDDDLSDRPDIYRRIQRVWRQMDWPQFAEATACYYAFCSLIDDQVGRIMDVLRQTGQEENTIVVYTSDHADYMGAHRLMLKGVPAFNEAYNVPLVMRGPGIASGRTIEENVSHMSLAPTLVGLTTGDDFPCQARSLQPLLKQDAGEWDSEAFAEFHGQRFFYTQRTLWRGRHKYVFNGFAEDELYDLENDPHEMRNLAGDPASGGVLEEMASRMWQIIRRTGDHNMFNARYGMFRFAPVGPDTET